MSNVPASLLSLPCPGDDSGPWVALMKDDAAKWNSAVSTWFFHDSVCDSRRKRLNSEAPVANLEACNMCNAAFATVKALQCHQRRVHGTRVRQRYFAEADGVCPACGSSFQSRLRLLAHLCDTRRTSCWHRNALVPSPSSRTTESVSWTRLTVKRVGALGGRDIPIRWQLAPHAQQLAFASAMFGISCMAQVCICLRIEINSVLLTRCV